MPAGWLVATGSGVVGLTRVDADGRDWRCGVAADPAAVASEGAGVNQIGDGMSALR
jgi:hypothetical protein